MALGAVPLLAMLRGGRAGACRCRPLPDVPQVAHNRKRSPKMPKVRKRKTAGGALDPFAPAPADGTEGAMMRFHRLQQRELRKKIQDLEVER